MSSRTPAHGEVVSAPPVFFLHEETPDSVTHVDICQAAERLVGFGSIVGAQRLGGLWRLYPVSMEVRAKLLTSRLLLQGKSIPLTSQNPFSLRDKDGREIPSTRLTIDGLPVSVASADLEGYLRKAGAAMRSPLLWEKARDRDGKLTRWVTGRRFVWIDLPTSPLPHQLQIGSFTAKLFYREQPRPALVCFQCGKEGHRRGDAQCTGPVAEQTERPPGNLGVDDASNGEASDSGESRGEEDGELSEVKGTDEEVGAEVTLEPEEGSEVDVGNRGGKEGVQDDGANLNHGDAGRGSEGGKSKNKNKKGGRDQKGSGNKHVERGSTEKGNGESSNKGDRGRRQTALSDHFSRFERTPSLKRHGAPSPTEEEHRAQRPRND